MTNSVNGVASSTGASAPTRQFVKCKLHTIVVTDKSVKYHGSVSICRKLLKAVGIQEYEAVDISNQRSGVRWTTYVIGNDEEGAFTLCGGGARLGEIGDECVIVSYEWNTKFTGAKVVVCDPQNKNKIIDVIKYEHK